MRQILTPTTLPNRILLAIFTQPEPLNLLPRLHLTNMPTVYGETKQRHNNELFKCDSMNNQQTYCPNENCSAETHSCD